MNSASKNLLELIKKGDRRAIARLITLSENRSSQAREIQAELFQDTGSAKVIGVTGAPGAGKSTLVDKLALEFSSQGKEVAVLAIDPTSPFSGGAILGDRIRMTSSLESTSVFVRSMATRGSLGGLSAATFDTINILDAAGFDVVIVETVGVGQAEVDIARTAETCIVVLVPGLGDGVQIIKAGILEIADLFVINKSDRDGADALQRDLRTLLSLHEYTEDEWRPSILRSVATRGEGVTEILAEAEKHQHWLRSTEAGGYKRLGIMKENLLKLARELLYEQVVEAGTNQLEELVKQCYDRKLDIFSAARLLIKEGK